MQADPAMARPAADGGTGMNRGLPPKRTRSGVRTVALQLHRHAGLDASSATGGAMNNRNLAGIAVALALAAPPPPAVPAPQSSATPAPARSEAAARDTLMRMVRFLGQAPAFGVTVLSTYDAVQASGQKIEFTERRKVTVARPDRLRVETDQGNGSRTTVVFTGKEMVLVDAAAGAYASTPQTGGIDESIRHFVGDLGMRLPLAVLLMAQAPAELERRVRTVAEVETTSLLGVPAHHLAARTDTVDFQVWVSDGQQPVPLQVVITYRNEPGQPEFRAQFSNWNFAPNITTAMFQPDIPAGLQKVPFAAQLQANAAARTAGSRQ